MRGPLRGVVLWQIFRTIRQRAQPDSRVDAVVEFRIGAGETVASTTTNSRLSTAGAGDRDATHVSRR